MISAWPITCNETGMSSDSSKYSCFWNLVVALIFHGGVLLGANVSAAVIWDYSMTDGTTIISGSFTTNGEFSDTQGMGTAIFNIVEWDPAISFNSVVVPFDDPVNTADPSASEFEWSRDSQTVTELERGFVRGVNNSNSSSKIEISLGTGRFDPPGFVTDSDGDPSEFIFFNDSNAFTTFTPVPEIESSALVVFIALIGFLAFQHRKRMLTAAVSMVAR